MVSHKFAGRHNIRVEDTAVQMAAMVHGMTGKRLKYRDLIAPTVAPALQVGSDVF